MQDHLKTCMTDPALVKSHVPIDLFMQSFCTRCIQSDCSRSRMNESSMRTRSLNWKNDLFDNVPKASTELASQLLSKKFLPGRESKPINANLEIMNNTEVEKVISINISPEKETINIIEEKTIDPPKEEEVVVVATPKEEVVKKSPPIQPTSNVSNTTFKQGMILNKEKEVILEPGSTYTFDSED